MKISQRTYFVSLDGTAYEDREKCSQKDIAHLDKLKMKEALAFTADAPAVDRDAWKEAILRYFNIDIEDHR